jgi:hypothetical protein
MCRQREICRDRLVECILGRVCRLSADCLEIADCVSIHIKDWRLQTVLYSSYKILSGDSRLQCTVHTGDRLESAVLYCTVHTR